jgi:mono/diheme cytochrome c family protein
MAAHWVVSILSRREPKMTRYAIAAALTLSAIAGAALAQPDTGPPHWMANMSRLHQVVMNGIPRPYAAMRDPSPDTLAKLRRGAAVFDRHCAACHGVSGQGSGPDAFALVPAPADLEWLVRTPESRSESYMDWSIAEGGKSFGSEMPAFKQTLSRKDRWSVIAYIRAGFSRP